MGRVWFSNFLPFDEPMLYQGMEFKTPEHFYQAMKSKDIGYRQKIAAAATPAEAKRLGRNTSISIRGDWNDIKIKVMRYALEYKFKKGTTWYKRLLETAQPLVEHNTWHDNFWGHCTCDKCKPREKRNTLGCLLMEIRRENQ